MACEKQMPPLAALVFHGAHYIKNTYLNYIFNILHISCLRIIIQPTSKNNIQYSFKQHLIKINKKEVDHMKGIICIGRQYGSGGREVGEKLARNWESCYV